MAELSHVDEQGNVKMVDVTHKEDSQRMATATGTVFFKKETLQLIKENKLAKGEVINTAKIAGIMAAKKTSELIPLCHPLALTHISVEVNIDEAKSQIQLTATARTTDKTGVEMEAMIAVSVAALTIYDMAKAVDKEMVLGEIKLLYKSGGKSGEFKRE